MSYIFNACGRAKKIGGKHYTARPTLNCVFINSDAYIKDAITCLNVALIKVSGTLYFNCRAKPMHMS